MRAWKRWQDYAPIVFGAVLVISPFLVGEAQSHKHFTRAAYVLGALLAASGLIAAANRQPRRSLVVNAPGIAAAIALVAAIIFAVGPLDNHAPGIAAMAGVMGILTLLTGYTLRFGAALP
jgi:hypothetical protein